MFGIGIAQAGTSPQHLQVLTAQEVRKLLTGQTITDGHHWRYRLKPDGSIDALEMGRSRKGRWHFDAHRLCINIMAGAAPSACWELIHDDKGFGRGLALGFQGHPVQDIQIIPTQREEHHHAMDHTRATQDRPHRLPVAGQTLH